LDDEPNEKARQNHIQKREIKSTRESNPAMHRKNTAGFFSYLKKQLRRERMQKSCGTVVINSG